MSFKESFQTPQKTSSFYTFLGPEASQESLKKPKSRPRSTQRAPKAHAKNCQKNPKKCLHGKKCLKLAISFKSVLGYQFWWPNLQCFVIIFQHFADLFSGNFWNPSWSPFLDQIGPREAKMNPIGQSRASKNQKPSFTKTLKNHLVF